ncbi:MarR family winged helix-turn-helix transcriptional regulator [Roseibium sp.]|uniref:MarR family winged helix-turn-helix transcriptional regulator n=1 Tax=Roseibium sp. TaxID=1936156 RepID=UPI003A96B8DB
MTRRYDRAARQIGLRASQFSVLAYISKHEGQKAQELAGGFSMERTTLLRNISGLLAKGLVRDEDPEKGKGRCYFLTETGKVLLKEALPLWQKAQRDLAEEIGEDEFRETVRALKRLSTI